MRINSAADDAAGFAIREKMRSQVSSLNLAMRNSMEGVSLLETAEGALGETNLMLQRIRKLAVQASSDSLTSQDRQYLQKEIEELRGHIDRIAETTEFNKRRILDGSSGAMCSSSDLTLKARINGGLTRTDEFGQEVSSEGNYRIEVRSDPGEPQVQKSNIMHLSSISIDEGEKSFLKVNVETIHHFKEEIVTVIEEREYFIELNGGDNGEAVSNVKEADNLEELENGWSFNSSSHELTIEANGVYRIVGKDSTISTQNRIVIKEGVNAQIFLDSVNIDKNNAAIEIQHGASLELFLQNTNILQGDSNHAGI